MKKDGKSRVTDHTREGKVADYALASAIVLAPVLGGGSNLYVLPVIAAATLAAVAATFLAARRCGTSIHFTALSLGLFFLALFTWLQAVPLPLGLVSALSPK